MELTEASRLIGKNTTLDRQVKDLQGVMKQLIKNMNVIKTSGDAKNMKTQMQKIDSIGRAMELIDEDLADVISLGKR